MLLQAAIVALHRILGQRWEQGLIRLVVENIRLSGTSVHPISVIALKIILKECIGVLAVIFREERVDNYINIFKVDTLSHSRSGN